MGDAENALPPSKKRAAGRELSRDNPGLNDEEEVQETGTFKKASEEVLANRRILKVRRSQPSATPNPFAAIRLVPPTGPAATPAAAKRPEVESPDSVNNETVKRNDKDDGNKEAEIEDKGNVTGNTENTPPIAADADANNVEQSGETASENEKKDKNGMGNTENTLETKVFDGNKQSENEESEAKRDIEDKKTDNVAGNIKNTTLTAGETAPETGNTESTPAATPYSSFQQLSSNQNAFTGLAGTGFSSSTFSFGSVLPKTDPSTFPSLSFGDKTEGIKIPTMQEVQVATGEENEKTVFTADSVLFEFLDGGWKERGKGELKVNVLTTGARKARLVMRARGNYRLILNASIFPDMKMTNMDKKGITFACFNSTGEGQDSLSTFALKFKDASIVEEFRSVVMEHKGNATDPTVKIRTPENSPKASEE